VKSFAPIVKKKEQERNCEEFCTNREEERAREKFFLHNISGANLRSIPHAEISMSWKTVDSLMPI
jgi:glucose-6-phosphate 1-dehydrogenase